MNNQDHMSLNEWAIATTPAPEPGLPIELQLIRSFEERGEVLKDVPGCVRDIELFFDAHGDLTASRFFVRLLDYLGESKEGRVLARILTADKTPLRDAAKTVGLSHEGLRKKEGRIKARLMQKDTERKASTLAMVARLKARFVS
jgi:hypothetical protein